MGTEAPRFQVGEYIFLTRPCLGFPAQSVGVITRRHSRNPPLYLVYFGASLPVGPFPAHVLSRLRSAHRAPHSRSRPH